MHLFSSERPTLASGQKALLGENSIVPNLNIQLKFPDIVTIAVMLRNYADADNRSYSWRETTIKLAELEHFIAYYTNNPEEVLEKHFGWKTQNNSAKPKLKRPTYLGGKYVQSDPYNAQCDWVDDFQF